MAYPIVRAPTLAPALMIAGLMIVTVIAAATPGPVRAQDTAPAEAPTAVDVPVLDLEVLPATLLMSLEEMISVETAIASGPLARTPRGADPEDPEYFRLNRNLYLSAILYRGPAEWVVWVNGQAVTPDRPSDLFEVVAIGPDRVRLAVPWGEGGTRDIDLAAHQTFVPRRGEVFEGKQ